MYLLLGIPHAIHDQSPGNAGPSAGAIAGGVIFVLIILAVVGAALSIFTIFWFT